MGERAPRATSEDFAEIRAGNWDYYGDISRLIWRMYFTIRDLKAENRRLRKPPDARGGNDG